jgi:Tol biopolymer transport system component
MRRSPSISIVIALVTALALAFVALPATALGAITTERISVSTAGVQSFGDSDSPSISADGRFVAFASSAPALVEGDTNGLSDVFVRDRLLGTTERVSLTTGGTQVQGRPSWQPSISADGRFVAFSSSGLLSSEDTNNVTDIYVRDTLLDTTELVSVPMEDALGDHDGSSPSISADGHFVAFVSESANFVVGDTNGLDDVFVRDLLSDTTERVSVSTTGTQGDNASGSPSISTDGRYVAFRSWASNLVANDTAGNADIFVHDRQLHTTERMSVATGGAQGDSDSAAPCISGDGRFIAFASEASNLVPADTLWNGNIFIRDRLLKTTEQVSVSTAGGQSDQGVWLPAISSDGRYVAFASESTNLVSDDANGRKYDVFVRDRIARVTQLVSLGTGGVAGDEGSGMRSAPAVSSDGRYVAYESVATNLVVGDTNGMGDVFLADRGAITDFTAPHTTSNRVAYYANSATISLTASDWVGGSGVVHTYYALNGGSEVDSSTVKVSRAGVHNLVYWSIDLAGNVEPTHTVTFTVIQKPASNGTPSTPATPSSVKHAKSFTTFGYVIKHTSGTYPVTLQFYRYEHGHWRLRKSITAKASNILTFSKYSRSTSVPYTGKWRVRARHKVGSKYRYGGYRYFTAN